MTSVEAPSDERSLNNETEGSLTIPHSSFVIPSSFESRHSAFAPAPHRIWLMTNAPSPYQVELMAALAGREDVELSLRFMRGGDANGGTAAGDTRSVVMAGLAPRSWRDEVRLHPRALWEAAFGRYDSYVLSGFYTSATFLCCALVLWMRGRPWAVWLERPRPGRREEASWRPSVLVSTPIRRLRALVLRWLLTKATRVVAIGSMARDAYAELGASPDRLEIVPYCCRVERFDEVDEAAIQRVRQRFALAGKTVFLFAGQLIPRKGVDTALAAFAQVAKERADVALLILGRGPLREQLEASVVPETRSRVHFVGHVSQSELPVYFRAADVFLFPSRHDGWGVVVNEACAARLPVIATRQTGAAADLVREGENGFVLDAADTAGFAQHMEWFLDHSEQMTSFGERSRELVEHFSADRGAETLRNIVARMVSDCREPVTKRGRMSDA